MKSHVQVTIFTDGACLGNPGPGGYGSVIVYNDHREELSGGYKNTTNNRMELIAAIKSLQSLHQKCQVTLYSDSTYLVKAMSEGWPIKWKSNGWKRYKNEKAKNPDLWEQLIQLGERHEIEFRWVKGHNGVAENERCDTIARQAAEGPNLMTDYVYETDSPSSKLSA
jgi:ribonuclease HI